MSVRQLQRGLVVWVAVPCPRAAVWWLTEPLLVGFGQDHHVHVIDEGGFEALRWIEDLKFPGCTR